MSMMAQHQKITTAIDHPEGIRENQILICAKKIPYKLSQINLQQIYLMVQCKKQLISQLYWKLLQQEKKEKLIENWTKGYYRHHRGEILNSLQQQIHNHIVNKQGNGMKTILLGLVNTHHFKQESQSLRIISHLTRLWRK